MTYGYIVIGAGSAGAVIAARLSENPTCSVLLLEAGPDYPDLTSLPDDLKNGNSSGPAAAGPHNWGYLATANEHQSAPIPIPRGKTTGGSSAINGTVLLRGLPEDYDNWAAWGNPEWAFDKVLPYFRRIERDLDCDGDFHGQQGPMPVRRHAREHLHPLHEAFYTACLDAGFPPDPVMNAPASGGVGCWPKNYIDGLRVSTALTYLQPARHRLNLTIRSQALARRILFATIPGQALGSGIGVALENATTAGTLRLASADPHASPVINYNYLAHPWDRERMRQGVRLVAQLTQHPAYTALLHERLTPTNEELASDEILDAWMLTHVTTQHHSSGTCKMGPNSDRMAVVNQYGQVHGLEGLRVVDASIMPDVIRANTNATVIMIGERVADWLRS